MTYVLTDLERANWEAMRTDAMANDDLFNAVTDIPAPRIENFIDYQRYTMARRVWRMKQIATWRKWRANDH